MRKSILKFVFCLMSISMFSQGVETFVLAAGDAGRLAENYVNPFVKGFMYDLNGGWYTTAKTHKKKFGFDLTINPSISFVPASDEFFTFVPGDYSYLSLPNGENSLPTVMSDSDQEALVEVRIPYGEDTYKVAEFDMPGGIGADLPIKAVPVPMAQVGFGFFGNTDFKVRFVPSISPAENFKFDLFGLGVQHSILPYFKVDNPILNVSVLAAFTNMKMTYTIENDTDFDEVDVQNGAAEFKVNTWTLQAIASVDLKLITFYGAVGYNSGKSSVKMKGDYTLTYDVEDGQGNMIGSVPETISDPISMNFQANGMRGTLGTRLNLGFFKIFADYTFQEYNTLTGGIAFSFN